MTLRRYGVGIVRLGHNHDVIFDAIKIIPYVKTLCRLDCN